MSKEKKGFFARRKESKMQKDFNAEEDMYYGIQLKPIDEYAHSASSANPQQENEFKKLFDDHTSELDDEVAESFQRLQQERRRRVAQAVENSGMNAEDVANEFGFVAPMPVSVAEQIHPEQTREKVSDFQRAMMEDAQTRTMEFVLDPEKNALGVQQAKVHLDVSEESVQGILSAVQEAAAHAPAQPMPQEPEEAELPAAQTVPETPEIDTFEDLSSGAFEDLSSSSTALPIPPEAAETPEAAEEPEAPTEAPTEESEAPAADETEEAGTEEPTQEEMPADAQVPPPQISAPVTDVTEYRKRDLPVHLINADVLQSALLSEAAAYSEENRGGQLRSRMTNARLRLQQPEPAKAPEPPREELDDFTGPEDAKSVAHDLRSTMRSLSLRMLVTGACTVVLLLLTFINEAGFHSQNTETVGAVSYTITSLIFLLLCVGFCAKSLLGGLRALFAFRPNSDSAVAVSVCAVLVQLVAALVSIQDLASGKLHLYSGIVAGLLFLNTLGKMTLVRRIHSNFRFVASREPKYAVRIFDDYNASLKLVGSSVVSQPTLAYQQKTGFLKRFLQISYAPDPAETASHVLAPVGLISSLVLCVVSLAITHDSSAAITALAACCCVCVAATNLLAVNLPVSRMTQKLRRTGAMVSGYEGIKRMSLVNAVLVDSAELFPAGTVTLSGVKPFVETGLEKAVLAGGALMDTLGGPLRGVFEQVLSDHEDDLPTVKEAGFDAGNGVRGVVDGEEVLIGSRTLLMAHGIEAPDAAVESQYNTGNRQVLYLAVGGVLYAMFILVYTADRKKKAEMQAMQANGVSLVVRSTDANLTPDFLGRLFGIDGSGIRVIGAGTEEACDRLVTGFVDRVDAYAATKGRSESMMRIISACIEEKKIIGYVLAMQSAAVVIGFVLVAFLTFVAGVEQITTIALLLYELFWVLAIVILPKIRSKY